MQVVAGSKEQKGRLVVGVRTGTPLRGTQTADKSAELVPSKRQYPKGRASFLLYADIKKPALNSNILMVS